MAVGADPLSEYKQAGDQQPNEQQPHDQGIAQQPTPLQCLPRPIFCVTPGFGGDLTPLHQLNEQHSARCQRRQARQYGYIDELKLCSV